MKVSGGLVVSGALLVAALPFASKAFGEDQTAPTGWRIADGVIYHGEIEMGGRGFIERPANEIRTTTSVTPVTPATIQYTRHESRAKFEEYGDIRPGFIFDHLNLGAASKDGRYYFDFYAKNVGNNDQSYDLEMAQTGRHYLTFGWDQTPHLYSTTAQSIFGGTPTNLTTSANLSDPAHCNNGNSPDECKSTIDSNLHTISLGIRRDKGTAEYRFTPTPDTEFKVEYSHERRTGNQETGVTVGRDTGGPAMQVPKPIADTTQDARASWQYSGTSPWGKKFNVNLQYAASIYKNDDASFNIQNPFSTFAGAGAIAAPTARYSLMPNNTAQSITGTIGADLPAKSRYMGTFSYTMMRQDQDFLPFTINSGFGNTPTTGPWLNMPGNGQPWNSTAALPRSSLNGAIDTLLFNNVLTTQISPNLKSKLSYRYYSVQNNTPALNLTDWIINDTIIAHAASASYAPHHTQFSSYVKQNAGGELNWRATSWLNTGVAYGWERYQRDQANVNVTNENSVKIFADAKPTDQINIRSSYQYSLRRYENYDYTRYVWAMLTDQSACPPGSPAGSVTTTSTLGVCAGTGGIQINSLMRIYNLADRDRNKANVYVDFDLTNGIVVTPTFGLRYDKYPTDPNMVFTTAASTGSTVTLTDTTVSGANQLGLRHDNSWNAGLEASYKLNRSTTLMASYVHEDFDRSFDWASSAAAAFSNHSRVNVKDYVDTVTAAVNFELKPNTTDLKFGYTYAHATETGGGASCVAGAVVTPPILGTCTAAALANANLIPNVTTNFHRFEGVLKYKFDQERTRQFGPTAQAYFKLRYAFELNRVANWQTDSMMPYMYAVAPTATSGGNKTWLAGDNPNYQAQILMATLGMTW